MGELWQRNVFGWIAKCALGFLGEYAQDRQQGNPAAIEHQVAEKFTINATFTSFFGLFLAVCLGR